ncbi:DUF5615 family PIN-like protein [Paramicrobacterium fandaimingii]|uniref:DUF5615 family PIN-like protein n=1 Tax=Paramicrobacterium fandaimingii TaxID=2708079 RepID=UPI001421A08B|nr:DUF5615 family PIN-like protein [Microbacterium fandaimingii]
MTAFLVDQQLPAKLAEYLSRFGHDARHVKQYPGGTTMRDAEIAALADHEGRTVLTKDDDFRVLHLTRQQPARILIVTCGNIATRDLLALVDQNYSDLTAAVEKYSFVELDRDGVFIHDPH